MELEQEQARIKFAEINKVNEEQDQRLKLLEIQEKADQLIKGGNYRRAYEYLLVGLEKDPNNLVLLSQYIYCLTKLKLYVDALSAAEKYLQLSEDNIAIISYIIEFSLLLKKKFDYEKFIALYRARLIQTYSDFLLLYFEAMRIYFNNDKSGLIKHIKSGVDNTSVEKGKNKINRWQYDDARVILEPNEDTPTKLIMLQLLDFLEGKISGHELINYIDEANY